MKPRSEEQVSAHEADHRRGTRPRPDRPTSRHQESACWAISHAARRSISVSRNSMGRMPASTDSRCPDGNSTEPSNWRSLTRNRSSARRLRLQPALKRHVDLALRPSPDRHRLLATREPPAQDPTPLIGHRLGAPFHSNVARAHASNLEPCSRGRDPCAIPAHHDHAVNARLQQPGEPAHPVHLQHNPIAH